MEAVTRVFRVPPVWMFALLCAAAEACPMCKEAFLEPGQPEQRLSTARGYALSVGLMLAVPVCLLGTMAAAIVRVERRRHSQGQVDRAVMRSSPGSGRAVERRMTESATASSASGPRRDVSGTLPASGSV